MERLTEKYEGWNVPKGAVNAEYDMASLRCFDKLAEYEQAEEDGLLIRLPCKEGTEVFLSDYPDYHFKLKEYKFCRGQVVMVLEWFELNNTCKRMLNDFGKTVFLTKAEQTLAKMKGV